MRIALFMVCLLCLLTPLAGAQTKISSTIKCGKYSVDQTVPAGDHANHFFSVQQGSCTETKPWVIAGVKGKEGIGASTSEVDGGVTKSRGLFVETMENGDQAHYRYELTAAAKDGQVQITSHKWQLVEGTGKLKGVKGQGTCKGSGTMEGGITYDCEGEYTGPK